LTFSALGSLAFLSLIPVIIVLHMVRRQRRRVTVSSVFLWEEVLQEHRRRMLLRSLLRNLALLVQICVVILAVVGMARPHIRRPVADHAARLLLLIDTSAGMQAESEGGGTRFDEAVDFALSVIGDRPANSETMVAGGARSPRIASGFTSDRTLLRSAVRSLQATDQSGSPEELLDAALTTIGHSPRDRTILVTDRRVDLGSLPPALGRGVTTHIVGTEARNVGITAFQFRRTYADPGVYELMTRIDCFSDRVETGGLIVEIEGVTVDERSFRIPPGESVTFITPYDGRGAGRAVASIDVQDALDVDNRAYAVLRETAGTVVQLVTPGNAYLESAFRVFPNVTVVVGPAYEDLGEQVTVFDRVTPPPLPEGSYLFVATTPPTMDLRPVRELTAPRITGYDSSHPILRNVRLDDVSIYQAFELGGGAPVDVVVQSDEDPLVYTLRLDGTKAVGITFDILTSDLPLKTAFPILVANVMTWLLPESLETGSAQVRAGETAEIAMPGAGRLAAVRLPDGREIPALVSDDRLVFSQTDTVGFHRAVAGDVTREFAVNLASPAESDLRRDSETATEAPATRAATFGTGETSETPVWRLFLLVALLAVCVEWVVWAREQR
jgi:hypothetical protein